MDIIASTTVTDILKRNGIANINLEDNQYQVKPKDYYVPKVLGSSRLRNILGFKQWYYAVGGSDCGKFAVRYASKLFEKYEAKEGVDFYSYNDSEMPALLVGFVKYYDEKIGWHIVNSTIIKENDEYKLVFFERSQYKFRWINLSQPERASIKYFYAF